METYEEAIMRALSQTPGYSDIPREGLQIKRQGGMTNLVFRVDAPGQKPIVVRVAGAGTEEYINREAELINARAAARAGVAPQVLFSCPDEGLLVMECCENIVTLTPAGFASIEGSPGRAGAALRQLHQSGEEFSGRFELFQMIDDYLDVLKLKGLEQLPEGYHEVVKAAEPIKRALEDNPVPLAPSHCDPLCENFLDDGTKMWIVDYEYGGMNDPMWDLGDLSVEGEFSPEMEHEMLVAYFGRSPSEAEFARVVIYKAMCDLLWTLWGLIQFADDNPAEDFWAYAIKRFNRCKALMDQPDFQSKVAAIGS